MSGTLYYNLAEYKASIIALQNSLQEFPDTRHREELIFLLLKSNYLLAVNSVPERRVERYQDTVNQYYSFVGEFPDSPYRREADRMYREALDRTGGVDLLSGQE